MSLKKKTNYNKYCNVDFMLSSSNFMALNNKRYLRISIFYETKQEITYTVFSILFWDLRLNASIAKSEFSTLPQEETLSMAGGYQFSLVFTSFEQYILFKC